MTIYDYTDLNEDTLTISGTGSIVNLIARMKRDVACVYILNVDAPTVALELLKAAGRTDLAGYIAAVVEREAMDAREAAKKAKAEAAEKKLQERRDALAQEYHALPYGLLGGGGQKFIDAHIALQDKLDGASRD